MPGVSVIIPFYNHKEWLEETLESVFSQTYDDFEVILVNDGSKEDISDILSKYAGKILYREQENLGPAAARNLAMSIASGEYIAFEDSDDLWLPDKLEKQISFMKECGAVWSHTGFYYWWPDENKLKIVNVSRDYGDIYAQRLVSVKMATPCVVIKRQLLIDEDLTFPIEYRNGEDGHLFSQIARNHPVALIQEPLAKIRMRGTNSNSHAIERFRLEAETFDKLKKQMLASTPMLLIIKGIYKLYSRIFIGSITPFKEFLAKCFWTIPFGIERIYIRYLANHSNKDEKYILRWNR